MSGNSCLLLETGCDPGLFDRIRQLLDPGARVRIISCDWLLTTAAQAGAELGAIIVPFDQGSDLNLAGQAIAALRDRGVNLSVLGVADSADSARHATLGDLFDDLACACWGALRTKMIRFMTQQRQERGDRGFRAFLDTSVDGFWIWDMEANSVEWSQRTCDMVGLTMDQSPRNFADFVACVHPQDRDRVQQAISNHFHRGSPYRNVEFRVRRQDDSYGEFVANGQALRDETGTPIILVGSLTDRTQMIRVAQQLEDTQRRFTVLFHRMNDAAVLADVETGLIVEANEPAERLWGRTISELVGTHQTTLHPPVLTDVARQAFEDHIAALMKMKRASIQVPILHKDGTVTPTEISSSLIEFGGRTMILGVFRDIADRVKAERDLRERDAQIQLQSHLASMGTLAAGVAHEINNPLTYVMGNLDFLRNYMVDHHACGPEQIEAIDAAITGANFLREIVTDLKAISRMDANENACDSGEVVRIATRMAMSDLRHRCVLDLDLQDVPRVPISSARLTQVVLNIFTNAARSFGARDRSLNRIKVSSTRTAEGVELRVTDNGSGISREDLNRVFEPFFTRHQSNGGTGLGLSICRRILSEVGGTLGIESELGNGTTVTVFLPAAEPMPVAKARREDVDVTSLNRPRVLVLDDDYLVSQLIRQIITRDCDVTVFNNALEALALLRGGARFDIILCDLMMPDLNGSAFHAAVQELPDPPPFLFITGGGVTDDCIELERRWSKDGRLLYKPFAAPELRRRLAEILAEAGPAKQQQDTSLTATDSFANLQIIEDLEEILEPAQMARHFQRLLSEVVNAEEGITAALGSEQMADVVAIAHKVAGSASVLGVERLAKAFWACEIGGREGDGTTIRNALADLQHGRKVLADVIARAARNPDQPISSLI